MEHQSADSRNRRTHSRHGASDAPFTGIPLWTSVAIVAASLITGSLLSINAGTIGIVYIALFVLATLATTVMVVPSGLFILVSSIPTLFAVITVATGIGIVLNSPGEANGLSTTELITSLYPLMQHFPVMAFVTAACAIIAVVRLKLLQRNAARKAKFLERTRAHDAAQDRRNMEAYSRSRSLASKSTTRRRNRPNHQTSVTVDELVSRNVDDQSAPAWKVRKQTAKKDRPRRSFNDDLYS